ncbi:hypothetical protein [Massilia sp. NP310]|uniref:hypothetical protein n=1 Tax=Massilia sp. NP310 TaxID=2861282 RepID=UPI001C62BB51|nr:hypothetical protein [Massilia sp. NP310]QYG01839.1 hypothetical protein KY496_26710 [Massilia sp. NP310]
MKSIALLLASVLFAQGAPAGASEPITVLGLPLGGKLPAPVGKCKNAPPKRDAGACWVYSRKWPGGVSGSLHLPDDPSRPTWAAYAMFEASIAKDGTLKEFTVESSDVYSFKTIVDSISSRFGRPALPTPPSSYMGFASWDRAEIGITTFCKISGPCYTKFVSAEVAADNRRRTQEVVKRDAARPIAP